MSHTPQTRAFMVLWNGGSVFFSAESDARRFLSGLRDGYDFSALIYLKKDFLASGFDKSRYKVSVSFALFYILESGFEAIPSKPIIYEF